MSPWLWLPKGMTKLGLCLPAVGSLSRPWLQWSGVCEGKTNWVLVQHHDLWGSAFQHSPSLVVCIECSYCATLCKCSMISSRLGPYQQSLMLPDTLAYQAVGHICIGSECVSLLSSICIACVTTHRSLVLPPIADHCQLAIPHHEAFMVTPVTSVHCTVSEPSSIGRLYCDAHKSRHPCHAMDHTGHLYI